MPESFNGYHVWLGIPLSEQPPNHYRLLGISIFESDLDVIDHAADRQMAHVRTFQSGRHGALSQQILNELAAARVCLLSPDKKTDYDNELRAKISAAPVIAAVPIGKALPVAPVAQPIAPVAQPIAPVAQPLTPAAKPVGPTPQPAASAAKPASRSVPAAKASPGGTAQPAQTANVSNADDDPFGLRAASGRRPVSAKQNGSLFDDAEIASGPKISVDLSRHSASTDVLIQKLAIYCFVAVASIIVLMVIWNTLTRNFGPPTDWFKAPVAAEPVLEKEQDAAPPAPMPGARSAPAPAAADGSKSGG